MTEQAVTETKYDVFLSYLRADALWVESLAARLKAEQGFSVWLDRWVLIPGQPWQREMAQGLKQARCCAVCINNDTPKGWCLEELEYALSLQVGNEKFGVLPVLLPDALLDSIPNFLSLRTWADFRTGQDQNYAFHVLCQGIRGEPVGFWQQSSPSEHSLSVYERRIIRLQRFRTLGLHEKVLIEFQRKILAEWLASGE
jgi:TIR domain